MSIVRVIADGSRHGSGGLRSGVGLVRGERGERGELRVGPEQVGGSVGELFGLNDPLCRCLLRGVAFVGDAYRSGANTEC